MLVTRCAIANGNSALRFWGNVFIHASVLDDEKEVLLRTGQEIDLSPGGKCYTSHVSAAEIINELPKLNETERRAILERLRELSHQDDEQWEQIIADPRPRPKLEAFVKEALSERSESLDLERL